MFDRAIAKEWVLRTLRTLFPTLLVLSLATVAHAQGTMDFSGAQTLMGTFKTFLAFARRADDSSERSVDYQFHQFGVEKI
jgi:hypothetical protein